MRTLAFVFWSAAAWNGPLAAADLFVPSQYPDVQSAINAAIDGDVVHVAAGTYNEAIRFKGKAITVRSTDGPAVTFLDGTGQGNAVVRFTNGEGQDSVLTGFTIQNGVGKFVGGERLGGGIYAPESSPTICGNVVRDNIAHRGGGIFCGSYDLVTNPRIEDNEILDNMARNGTNMRGAGIYLTDTEALVRNNLIRGNLGDGDCHGGGLCASGPDSNVTVEDNVFEENQAHWGGGIHLHYSDSALVCGNLLRANRALFHDGESGFGGGLSTFWFSGGTICDNVIVDNRSGGGGGLMLYDKFFHSLTVVADNLIVGNSTARGSYGGGVYVGEMNIEFLRNTIVDNDAGTGGGVYVDIWPIDFRSGIVYGNIAPNGAQFALDRVSAALDIAYSDVEGGRAGILDNGYPVIWGPGMIEVPPEFVDAPNGDYRLAITSPCIDAADPDDLATGRDVARVPRRLDGDLDAAMTIDMGAHEFTLAYLAVSGNATPGGTITLDLAGTPGFSAFLFYGLVPGETLLAPYGSVFLDLTGSWNFLGWPGAPSSVSITLPLNVPTPLNVSMQVLAMDPIARRGTFSNDVVLEIQ